MSDNNDPWFTAAKSEIDAGQAAQIRNNLQFSLEANPQKEAGIRQLYNATGIPLASIRDNEQDVRTAATLKQFDAHGLVLSTPATARLLTDPDNTRLLHDAIPNTMAVEKATAEPPATAAQALKRGLLGFSSWLGDSAKELGHGAAEWTNKAAGAVNIVVGGVPVILDKVAGTNTSKWWFDNMIKPPAERADSYSLKPDASFNQKLMHGIGGFGPMMAAVIGSGGTAAAPETAAAVSEGASALPAIGNAVGHAVKAMWFPAVTDAVNTGSKVYEATGDGRKALVAAGAQYTATTGMGLVPLSVTGGWATRAASGFVGQVAAGEGSRELMNAAMPDSMHTDFNWEDAFVNGTIGSLMGVTLGPRTTGYSMEPVRQTYLDAAKSDAAVADYNRLNVVSKMSSASVLRERDPALFKRFVSEVTEAQDVPDLYIDAHQLDQAFERASVTPDDLARTMPELAAQLPEARMAKGLVKIPMADYATHIAGTEIDAQILPHVRTDPEGMTYQEGQVFHQTQVEQMQAAVSKVLAGRMDDAQRQLSTRVVHDDVKRQLDSTGRVGADVAEDYAALHAAFFDSMASKMGVAPEEAYRQLGGARIVADGVPKPDTSNLYQSARESIQDAIGKAKDDKRYNAAHDIMPAAPEAIDEAAQHGMDITGFTHVIDGSAIRHVLKAHGNEAKELARGNLPISETDFNVIPDIIAAPDATVYGLKNDIGRDMIGYLKKMPDGSTLYLEEVRTGRKKLAMQSMRRYPQTTDATSILKSLRPTSEALPGNSAEVSVIEHPALRNSGPDSLAQGERGAYDPATRTLTLLKDADLSTFLHESGHFFLDTYARTVAGAGAPDAVKTDFDTLLKSFGVAGKTPEERAASWAGRDLNEQRDGHEQFARGFEQYLMDGKAPNAEMAGVFARFRSWLLSVYKTVSGLRADLAPEVREVMDRMLASEETIKNAESARGYDPLFDSAERAGMTKAEWDEYLSLGSLATQHAVDELQARSISDLKWAAEVKGNTIKAMQEDAALRRAEMREKVVREIDQEPVERVRNSLKNGLMVDSDGRPVDGVAAHDGANLKLSKPAIREMYPHDMPNRPDIDRLAPYSDAEGFHPDFLADMFGYPSGRELVDDLLHVGDRDAKVEAITDQRMLERYGDLTSLEAIEQAAELAIHNEIRARMIAMELKVAAKVDGSPTSISRAAKQIAEHTIEQKSVGELRPGMYTAAEARAARAAIKALSVNDLAAVGEEKRAQLLNNRLAKVTQDVIFEMEAGQRYLKKFSKASVAKNIGGDYMDRILGILTQFDLAARAPGADVPLRDWMQAEFERTGIMPAVADSLIGRQQRWSTLSVADFRELITSIKSLEHIGREQTMLVLDGKKVALDDLVAEATQSMSTLPHRDPVDLQPHLKHAGGLDKISTKFLNLKSKLRSGDAALLKMEQLFQWLDAGDRAGLADGATGAFSKIFKSMATAEGMERSMRADSVGELRALGEKLRESGIKLNDALVVGLPRKGRGTHWYREELLAVALNVGNESNMRKLTQGYEWEEAQVLHELDRHLSAPEWDFVQGVWNAIGKYGPQIEALQKRQTGVSPMMIEPRTVTTRHGEYTGGYYPVVFDAFLDRNSETKQARQADMLFENQWAKPSTSKGHTVERTGYVGPLQLSLGVITRHLDQVTHDLAWREPITDANKFLNDPRIKSEIDQTFGKEYTAQLRPWLQAMANDKVFNTSGDSAWESFYRKARSNVSIMGLGYRLSTMQIHGLSALSTSIGEVGVKWMAQGVAQFSGIDRMAKARDFVFERSPEMLNRSNEFDRNVAEAINEINAHESAFKSVSAAQKAVDGAKKFAFYGVAMLDMASAMPTWYGAYLKGMAAESKGGLNLSEEAAIEYANRAVRNAHGGGGTKDLAAIQRDKGAMSMATMFYSFWNHMYNRQRDLVKGYSNLPDSVAQGRGTKDFARLLARSWWYFVVPQVIHAALHPQKNDDGDLSASLLHMAEEVALGAISGVPVLRDLANAAVNGRAYTVTPLESAGKALVATASDASKVAHGEPAPPHMAKNAVQSAGYVYGLPLGQASNTGQFLWDVVDGTQQPQDLADWWRGISHGDMKKH